MEFKDNSVSSSPDSFNLTVSSFGIMISDTVAYSYTELRGRKYPPALTLCATGDQSEVMSTTLNRNPTETHGQVICFHLSELKYAARQRVYCTTTACTVCSVGLSF